jgi:hypothetical protein
MTADEFQILHDILKESDDPVAKYGVSAMTNFQFHMIARIDDTTQNTDPVRKPIIRSPLL